MRLVIKKEKWQSPIFEKAPSGQEGPNIRLWGFWQKYNPFICTFFTWIWKYCWYLTFCNNHMSGKNMVLGLWSLNHFTNQNVGFFKLQCHKRAQIWSWIFECGWRSKVTEVTTLFNPFQWVWSGMSGHAQSYAKSWVSFIARMNWDIKFVFCMCKGFVEVTDLFNYSNGAWSDMPKVIENKQYLKS